MAQQYQKFIIQLLRGKNEKEGHDDMIRITPNSSLTQYQVEVQFDKMHVENHDYSKTRMVLSPQELHSYLYNMFDLLSLDQDPYDHFQFDLPGATSILLNQERLLASRDTILHHLLTLVYGKLWPTYSNEKTEESDLSSYNISSDEETEEATPRHLFFDEESGEVIHSILLDLNATKYS
jgi:hypothetical protein